MTYISGSQPMGYDLHLGIWVFLLGHEPISKNIYIYIYIIVYIFHL